MPSTNLVKRADKMEGLLSEDSTHRRVMTAHYDTSGQTVSLISALNGVCTAANAALRLQGNQAPQKRNRDDKFQQLRLDIIIFLSSLQGEYSVWKKHQDHPLRCKQHTLGLLLKTESHVSISRNPGDIDCIIPYR